VFVWQAWAAEECFKGKRMLKIRRAANGDVEVVFTLSGRMDAENIGEMKSLLQTEAKGRRIVLDLRDLTLVDQAAVRFLERSEADNIQLKNCPAYIREWITRARRGS
jgi:anti-anti-sigma regulatory factor